MNSNVLGFISAHTAYFIIGIASATLAGCVAFAVWLFLSHGTARFYIKYSMILLKLCLACLLVPFLVSILLQILELGGMEEKGVYVTNYIALGLLLTMVLWLATISKVLQHRYQGFLRLRRLCRNSTPVLDQEILQIVEHWENVLGIKKQITAHYSEGVHSPSVVYYKGYKILLPTFPITKKELNIAVLHELMHLKRGDTIVRDFGFAAGVLHSANPISKSLRSLLTRWTEVNCDWDCCELGKELFTPKEYYNVILSLKGRSQGMFGEDDPMLYLTGSQELLNFRIDMMKILKEEKHVSRVRERLVTLLLVALLVFVSSGISKNGLAYVAYHSLDRVEWRDDARDYQTIPEENLFGSAKVTNYEGDISQLEESVELELESGEVMLFPLSGQGNRLLAILISEDTERFQCGLIDTAGEATYLDAESAGEDGLAMWNVSLQDKEYEKFFVISKAKMKSAIEIHLQETAP